MLRHVGRDMAILSRGVAVPALRRRGRRTCRVAQPEATKMTIRPIRPEIRAHFRGVVQRAIAKADAEHAAHLVALRAMPRLEQRVRPPIVARRRPKPPESIGTHMDEVDNEEE
jgi:hypothetical protein